MSPDYKAVFTNLMQPTPVYERNLLCFSITVLALNAVFCTGLRDGLPEWSRTSPFDCLYALIHQLTEWRVLDRTRAVEPPNTASTDDFVNEDDNSPRLGRASSVRTTHRDVDDHWSSPVMQRLLMPLSVTAGAAFIFIFTRHGFRWTKTFAIIYELYWLLFSKIVSRSAVPSDPVREELCKNVTLFLFSLVAHSLIWCLYSADLDVASTAEYWWYFSIHNSLGILVATVACIPRHEAGDVLEVVSYLCHINFFLVGWLSTFYSTMRYSQAFGKYIISADGTVDVGAIFVYDASIWMFLMAKANMKDNIRWPAAILAICLMFGVLAQVHGQGFRF